MSSWERMKFKCVGKSTVHERENRVCGESEVCVCDIRLASDVYRKSEFVREIHVHERESRMCGEGKVCVCDNGFESGV